MSTAYYRIYDLPWTPSEADERRVRRVLGAVLGLFIGFGVIIPLLPERERAQTAPPAVPERVVEFLLEREILVVDPAPAVARDLVARLGHRLAGGRVEFKGAADCPGREAHVALPEEP